jgi:hypothetical protein
LRIKHCSCAGIACCASAPNTGQSSFRNNNLPPGNNPHTGLGDTLCYIKRVIRTKKISDV